MQTQNLFFFSGWVQCNLQTAAGSAEFEKFQLDSSALSRWKYAICWEERGGVEEHEA